VKEIFEKWLRRGSKSFSHEIRCCLKMSEINKLVKLMELRKIFHSPLANHFSKILNNPAEHRL